MSKFVMECPSCGKYVEAKTGLFARRKIDCSCGHIIHVRTEKLSVRTCPSCGNQFVHDQSDGTKVRCPVCRHKVVTTMDHTKLVTFSCAQCGIRLNTSKDAATYTCPVCDFENDLVERLKTEAIKHDGLASIIKYEGDAETLVWKHPIEDFNYGSQLIVHESQEAIFFRDGQALDLFGAGRYTLETQQLPMLEKLYKLPTDTEGTFHSEVYYINMATQMGIKWGTDSKVRLFDPMSGMHVELGASGEFNIRVVNSRKFLLKIVGTTGGFHQDQLMGGAGKGFFRSLIMTQVKSYLASVIRESNISVLEIDERLMELSEALKDKINPRLAEYGLEMSDFFVVRVVTPDDDKDFQRMKKQFAEQYLGVREEQIRKNIAVAEAERKTVEAQTAAQMKIIGAQGDAEAYRLKAAAEAEEMRMKGYTYQQETARQVGMEAMKNGLTGNGGGADGLGDIAGLGIALGTMGSVVNMTRDAMNPMAEAASRMSSTMAGTVSGGWTCTCGQQNITTNFCPNCGTKKPQPETGWSCACGQQNITTNFCPNCGTKKPDAGWICPDCGKKDITTNFCPNCGAKKPDAGWICPDCGQKDIKSNFCPNCGHKKG